MSQDRNEIGVLTGLGLTLSQAKVYLTLIEKGASKVSVIAQTTKIYREHLYELLKSLEQKGLVEKKFDATIIYCAVPLDDALSMLVKGKQQEVSELENKVKTLVSTYGRKVTTHNCLGDKPEISVISNGLRTMNRINFYFERATKEIDMVQTWERFTRFIDSHEQTMNKIGNKKLKIRHLVEAPTNMEDTQNLFNKKMFLADNYQLQIVAQSIGNYFIVDNKVVCVSAKENLRSTGEATMMFSNYSGFLKVFRNNFELSWKISYPVPTAGLSAVMIPDVVKSSSQTKGLATQPECASPCCQRSKALYLG
jgi:sugar-specific transcriptional regulator TrmB